MKMAGIECWPCMMDVFNQGNLKMPKKNICYCQDLTEADLIRVIEEGYDHLESPKRFTGAFMGPCHGKMCAANILKLFAEKGDGDGHEYMHFFMRLMLILSFTPACFLS